LISEIHVHGSRRWRTPRPFVCTGDQRTRSFISNQRVGISTRQSWWSVGSMAQGERRCERLDQSTSATLLQCLRFSRSRRAVLPRAGLVSHEDRPRESVPQWPHTLAL